MLNILWASKTGNANSWYHIAPFRECGLVDKIHVVRYKKPKRVINDIVYHTFPSTNKFLETLYYIINIVKLLFTKQIDLVVAFNPYPWGLISFFLGKLFRKPVLLGLIGGELDSSRTGKFKRKLLYQVLKRVEIITVTGGDTKQYLSDINIKQDKVFVFPHLVDANYLNEVKNSQASSNIITITSFLPVKRTEDAIKAFALLLKQGLNLKMIILGEGPGRDNCLNLVKSLGVDDNIKFEGYVNDIRPYINNSEYYLQTSSSEGLSIALIESMATGLIPLVTNVGDEKEIIKDNETGFFIPVGEPEIIADKIAMLESSPLKNAVKENIKKTMVKSTIKSSDKYITEILQSVNRIRNYEKHRR